MNNNVENVVIIGSGPAGYTAAIYAARAGLKPLLITGPQPGGQLITTTQVENYPGFAEGIDAISLIEAWAKQAANFGTRFLNKVVRSVRKSSSEEYSITIECVDSSAITAQAVIVATGASAKWLNIPGEEQYKNKGISACATCDGFAFRNKAVAVIGGGDTAFEEALYLSNLCKKVYLVHRRDQFRASTIMVDRVKKNSKIEFILNTSPLEFVGDGHRLNSILCQDNLTCRLFNLEVSGAFVAIGHTPSTEFLNPSFLTQGGYIRTDSLNHGTSVVALYESQQTVVNGLFAAGDCADPIYRQAVTAAGEGCKAALDAERYLRTLGLVTSYD